MEKRPRLLDLFCCAGGASMGYYRAGFEVVGVDMRPQKRYPFEFHQADALTFPLDGFDAIAASPPCQGYSVTQNIHPDFGYEYPKLVEEVREGLLESGLPFVIENVPGAPLLDPVKLCGTMFPELNVIRHRLFETGNGFVFEAPGPCNHVKKCARVGDVPREDQYHTIAGHFNDVKGARKAMGIEWMTRDELAQAIPPAYTEWIGIQLIQHIEHMREEAA